MRLSLEGCSQAVVPDLDEINANIGPFSSDSDGTDGAKKRTRIRRIDR